MLKEIVKEGKMATNDFYEVIEKRNYRLYVKINYNSSSFNAFTDIDKNNAIEISLLDDKI